MFDITSPINLQTVQRFECAVVTLRILATKQGRFYCYLTITAQTTSQKKFISLCLFINSFIHSFTLSIANIGSC